MFALVKSLLIVTAATAAVHGFALGENDVVFHLFSRASPGISQPILPTVASIMSSSFLPSLETVITIHNYGDDPSGNFNAFVIPAHLNAADVNLLAVDWRAGASMYTDGLGNAPQVGRIIAQFINILNNDFGYSPSNVRIVGVGLGAHIAGIAARNVDGNIPYVMAIDPSFHGWTHHPDILNRDDAETVEVIHATAGITGYDYPLGDLDFYPNGGSYQTGCSIDTSCSHTLAYAFYAESITSDVNDGPKFVGTACDSYEEAIAQQCSGARDLYFGGIAPKTGSSDIYWFSTNIASPFARD